METKVQESTTGIRFTKDDRAILKALEKKLGLNKAGVVRMALRRLHDVEIKKAS